MYYPEDFLTRLWHDYLAEHGLAPEAVDPDAFIRHGFRALMAHRLPRYRRSPSAGASPSRPPRSRRCATRRTSTRWSPRRCGGERVTGHAPRPHRHGHDHAATATATHVTRDASARAVGIAALLTGGFMVAEVVGGLVSGSLALIADAGHMLTDFAALAMAWLAFRVARRPADAARTYGFDRLSVLAAFVNGLALFVVAAWIVVEAVAPARATRSRSTGGIMLAVAAAGLAVNLARLLGALARRPRATSTCAPRCCTSLGDLLGSVGADRRGARHPRAPAGRPIDPILSVLVALLILRSAWRVVRDSAHILLEGTPRGLRRRGGRRRPARRGARASSRSATCTPGRSPRRGRW